MFSVCSMFKVLFDEHVTEHQTTINKAVSNLLEKNYFQSFLVKKVTNCVEMQTFTILSPPIS